MLFDPLCVQVTGRAGRDLRSPTADLLLRATRQHTCPPADPASHAKPACAEQNCKGRGVPYPQAPNERPGLAESIRRLQEWPLRDKGHFMEGWW